MPKGWATTYVHVGVQGPMPPPGPCRSWWSVLPLRAMVLSRHEQLLALSGSMTLQPPGFILTSVVPVITEDLADAQGMGYHLRSCWYSRVMVLLESSWSEWPVLPPITMGTSGPELLPRAISGSMVCLYLCSVFMSMAYIIAWSHKNDAY